MIDTDVQPYLYNYAGASSKTQEWVRKIGDEEYNHTAGGLSGVSDPHPYPDYQPILIACAEGELDTDG
jgi:hypothetical protein